MKLVKAVIKPHKLDPVHEALVGLGVTGLVATEVKAFDRQMGHAEIHRGTSYAVAFMPMVEVEAMVSDGIATQVVDTIREKAGTGNADDGKIFVCDMLDAMRINSGETGDAAL